MGFDWLSFVSYIVFSLILEALTPKKTPEAGKPLQLSDFSFPTAQENRPLPHVWGKVKIAPNVLFAGNKRDEEVTKTIRTGLFSKAKQSLGFRYNMTLWLGLCIDRVDAIKEVWIGEKLGWSGNLTIGPNGDSVTCNPAAYWGTQDPADGLAGSLQINSCYIYDRPAILKTIPELGGADNLPLYPHFTHAVFDGFVGVNGNVEAIYVVVKRYADLSAFTDNAFISEYGSRIDAVKECAGESANPAFVLAEILTRLIPIDRSWLDRVSFLETAERLHSEGQGVNINKDSAVQAEELALEIMRQCNMTFYVDPSTLKIKLSLIREDDEVAYTFTESNIQGLSNFARSTNEDAINFIQVPFMDTSIWKESVAQGQDLGAIDRLNGQINKADQQYPLVPTADLACILALRDLQAFASPLCKCNITANLPVDSDLKVGDLVSVTYSPLNLVNGRFRVSKIDYAEAFKQVANISLMQDVFFAGALVYSSSVTIPEEETPSLPSYPLPHALYAPYALTGDEADHALIFLTPNSNTARSGRLGVCDGATWNSAEYEEADKNNTIAYKATATGSQLDLVHDYTASTLTVDFATALHAELFTSTLSNVLVLIKHATGYEYAKAQTATKNGAGKLELYGLHRGLFGSLCTSNSTTEGVPTELYVMPSFFIDPTPLKTALPWNTFAGVDQVQVRAIGINANGRGSFNATEAELQQIAVNKPGNAFSACHYSPLVMLGENWGASTEANAQSTSSTTMQIQHRNKSNRSELAYHDYATGEVPPADYSVRIQLYKKADGATEYEATPYLDTAITDATTITVPAIPAEDKPAYIKAVITTKRTHTSGDLYCGSYVLYWKS